MTSTQNNGDVSAQVITAPTMAFSQSYLYDNVDRLKSATETGPGTGWSETFNYDQFGNMWLAGSTGLATQMTGFTAAGSSNYDVGNHLTIQSAQYDGTGNLKQMGAYGYTYDGENRMVTSTLDAPRRRMDTTERDSVCGSNRRAAW